LILLKVLQALAALRVLVIPNVPLVPPALAALRILRTPKVPKILPAQVTLRVLILPILLRVPLILTAQRKLPAPRLLSSLRALSVLHTLRAQETLRVFAAPKATGNVPAPKATASDVPTLTAALVAVVVPAVPAEATALERLPKHTVLVRLEVHRAQHAPKRPTRSMAVERPQYKPMSLSLLRSEICFGSGKVLVSDSTYLLINVRYILF